MEQGGTGSRGPDAAASETAILRTQVSELKAEVEALVLEIDLMKAACTAAEHRLTAMQDISARREAVLGAALLAAGKRSDPGQAEA